MNKRLFTLLLLAFLIRLIAIDQSLWLDEGTTARVVREYGFTQIVDGFSRNDFHPPLYYFFMKAWTNIFGYSEISLRMLSLLLSLFSGYLVYLLGRKLRDEKTGMWAAIFFLFNPLIVYYSQEARMYMMATFLLTVATYYYVNLFTGSRVRLLYLLLFSIFISLSFATFYGAIFLIVPMLSYLLYKKRYIDFLISFLVLSSLFSVLIPLLYRQFLNAKASLQQVENWGLVLGKANIKNLLLIPVKFSVGRISFYPKRLYYLVAGGWTSLILYQISNLPAGRSGIKDQNDKLKRKNISLLKYLFITPLILGFFVSFYTPLLQYFRFLYLVSIMSILLSCGLSDRAKFNRSGWARWIVAGGFVILSLVYLLNPAFHREDWKSLARNLPEGKPVYMIVASSDALNYYKPSLQVRSLSSSLVEEQDIIVIPYASEIYGIDYARILKEKGYELKEKKMFRELWYEIWLRNKT